MQKYNLTFFDTLPSTNTALKEKAKQGAPEGEVVVARAQTMGKGSKGRSFFSPEGGLYFSLLLRPGQNLCRYLTPLAAVAVSRAIENLGFPDVKIKWVNDIYLNNKKVCGILTEGVSDNEGNYYAVVGIGINLSPPAGGFPSEIRDTATALFSEPVPESVKNALLTSVLDNISALYPTLSEKSFLAEYRARSCLIGKSITITSGNRVFEAVAVDINDDFELVVKTAETGDIALNSGDVQIKIACKNGQDRLY
ncbi:MAG TPA: biotin--[acetyl-CoA-carboxylase] ligase [Clostridia bacterium]|nr:biotin--[acetyl-CoA-carboxylase] ligase [Clostridia bacterium]